MINVKHVQFAPRVMRQIAIAALSAVGLTTTLATSVHAQAALSNATVQFDEETIVEFEVLESHGFYQSTFGIVNLKTGQKTPLFVEVKGYDAPDPSVKGRDDTGTRADFTGTITGGTIVNGEGKPEALIKFKFEAGTPYAFYLDSVDPRSKQPRPAYQSTSTNVTTFAGSLEGGDSGNSIKWDDSGVVPRPGKDADFDDFVILAGGYTLVPCPIKR